MKTIDWAAEAALRAQSGHALFGPSALPRIMRCVGSVRLCLENDAHGVETEYALEGTNAHALAQRCFAYDVEAASFVDKEVHYLHQGEARTFTPDADMGRYIQEYLDWCHELPGEHFVESRVDLSALMGLPEQFGTTDHAAMFGQTLIDTDFKFGMGEQVFAQENEQGLGYVAGLFTEWDWMYNFQKFVIRIAQPRLNHFDVWECDRDYLLDFIKDVQFAVQAAMGPNPTLTPGVKQCRFCPMSGRCAAQAEAVKAAVAGDFDAFDTPQEFKEALAPAAVAQALTQREPIQQFLKALDTQAHGLLSRGIVIPGWKLVEGRSNRCWKDEVQTEAWLKRHKIKVADMYAKALLGPAPIEKLFKKADEITKGELAQLWRKPPGSPVLAEDHDPRPPYLVAECDFDGFEDVATSSTQPPVDTSIIDDGL